MNRYTKCGRPQQQNSAACSATPGMSDSSWVRIVARQAPLSTGFSRQKYWSELPCLSFRGSSWSRDQILWLLCLLHWQKGTLPLSLWGSPTTEQYSATKRNEVLTQATTGTDFENIMLSERSQSPKTTYPVIPFMWNIRSQQVHGDRKQISGY